jgi:hypothetical protein
MRRSATLLAVALAVTTAACAAKSSTASGGTATAARRDRSIMDTTELRGGNFSSVYDAISALHADWLLPRGGPQTGRPPELGVWIEGQLRTRGVDYLKSLRPVDVKQVRRLTTTESLHTYSWPWGGLVITSRY